MDNQVNKLIIDANIAAGFHALNEGKRSMKDTSAALLELFTRHYTPDYDEVIELLGHEPTFSELAFLLSIPQMSPAQAKLVSTHLGSMSQAIFAFNCSEGDQPEDVMNALYDL